MVKDPKRMVKEIANRVGKHEARSLLVAEGVSTSTADKLVGDRYKAEVQELIRRAIARVYETLKMQAS